jgi:hypothetical protein
MPKLWRDNKDEVNIMKWNNKLAENGSKNTLKYQALKNKIETNIFFD